MNNSQRTEILINVKTVLLTLTSIYFYLHYTLTIRLLSLKSKQE